MKRTSILVLCLFAPAGLARAQSIACSRSPELEAALKPLSQPMLDYETRTALRRSTAESVLAQFPNEFLATGPPSAN